MTNIDLIFGIFLLIFMIWGMYRGLLWSLIKILSLVGVILVISSFGEEFRYKLGDMLEVSPAIATVIAYVLIFIIMMLIAKLVYSILKKVIKALDLGCMNRISGGLFAVFAYLIFLAMLVILFDISPYSLNSRGVRPQNNRLNIESLTSSLESEINSRSDELSEMELDRIWEAIDEANEEYSSAKDNESRNLALKDLYGSIQGSLKEGDFEEIYDKMQIKREDLLQFKGKEIVIQSLFLESIIARIADYIEIEIMGFDNI
ncbi:MAG: CvpA family protein [Candidatus Stygibacter frigidus]|nr:CvpA family protein [Candidatus Stygibacter frigidus]